MPFLVQRGAHGANSGVFGAVLRLSDLLGGLSWVAGKVGYVNEGLCC